MEKFKIKKAVYNENVEKQLSDIYKYYDYVETNEDESIILELEELYEETKYPGILSRIGEIYLFGQYKHERDKEKAIEYFTQAANDGYLEAMDYLGYIYSCKAKEELSNAMFWYDKAGLDYNDAQGKLNLGTHMMANYLISSSGTQYNEFHEYYHALGLIAESFQMGCSDANIILKILDKDQEFVNDYKNKIEKEHVEFIHKIHCYSDLDLDQELEEFLDDDGELPFE